MEKESKKVVIHIYKETDSLCHTAEANAKQTNYTPIKIYFKKASGITVCRVYHL